jgi:hypothetical protein
MNYNYNCECVHYTESVLRCFLLINPFHFKIPFFLRIEDVSTIIESELINWLKEKIFALSFMNPVTSPAKLFRLHFPILYNKFSKKCESAKPFPTSATE